MGLNTNQILFVDNSNQISLVNPRPNLHKIVNKGCYVWQFNDQQIRKDLLVDSCYLERFQEILLKFKDLGPVISRHYDDMPNMELHHRNLVFMTLRLANFLKEKQISIIVFPFASNHHLEGFILEFAAEIIGAKLIFLYPTVINLLVLPIIQTNGVESRSLFPINFSKILLQGDIADLIAQMVDKNSMQLCNLKFFPFLLVKKVFIILYYYKMFFTKKILIPKPKESYPTENKQISIKRELQILSQSFNALNYYSKLVDFDEKNTDFNQFFNQTNKCVLIMFAHYQPEATTVPEGGKWWNHIDIVTELRSKGFTGTILYKEHPALLSEFKTIKKYASRIGLHRSCDYYQQLRDLDCKFINEIVYPENSYIALTITGTISLERSLRNCKTIFAGHPWYDGLPGTISLDKFLNNAEEKNKFMADSSIAKRADDFLRKSLDGKSLEGVYFRDQFNSKINFEQSEVDSFKYNLNNLFEVLSLFDNLQ